MSKGIVDVLGRERTPAEPGPGTVTPESLRVLDLAIGRRVDGLLAGDFRSAYTGIGSEFHQVRPYEPGDDVRRIDWNVTARTGQTHVRVELAEHTLVTWLVLDESASMRFGTADRRKADVAEGVAIAIGHVATRRGNRLGVVAYGAGEPRILRPRRGRRGLLLALGAIRDTPAGGGSLGDAMNLVGGLAVERSLVVVVSDFRGPVDWRHGLLRVAARHATLAVEIRDPGNRSLPTSASCTSSTRRPGGTCWSTPTIRFCASCSQRPPRRNDARSCRCSASAGVPHVALSTEGDWLPPLAAISARSDRK